MLHINLNFKYLVAELTIKMFSIFNIFELWETQYAFLWFSLK